jgi:hypothetical protein
MVDVAGCPVILSEGGYWIVSASAERTSNPIIPWGMPVVTPKTVDLRLLAMSEGETVADPGSRECTSSCGRVVLSANHYRANMTPKTKEIIWCSKYDIEND